MRDRKDDVKRFLCFIQDDFVMMGFRVFLLLSACVIAAASAGTVRELRALNHLVDKLDRSVDKLAKKEKQV